MAQPGFNVPGTLRLGTADVTTAVEIGRGGALAVDNTTDPPTVNVNGGAVGAGTFTPALTNIAGWTALPSSSVIQWTQVGNIVMCQARMMTGSFNGLSNAVLQTTLPVPRGTVFDSSLDLTGSGTAATTVGLFPTLVSAAIGTTNEAVVTFVPSGAGGCQNLAVSFGYRLS